MKIENQIFFNDNVFLGLKLTKEDGDYFGWININKNGFDVTIISYGLNQSVNCPINAGQTE